ncbi:hypothetical protein ACLBWT_01705 [Paenibacillus sp. D51F]
MKKVFLILSVFLLAILGGCSKEKAEVERKNLNQPNNVWTINTIQQVLKSQGIELDPKGKQESDKVNNTIPYLYDIKFNGNKNSILVYVFSSHEQLEKGLKNLDFKTNTATDLKTIAKDNILFVHISSYGSDDEIYKKIEFEINDLGTKP